MKDSMKKHLPAKPAAPPRVTLLDPLYPLKPLQIEQPVRREGSYDFAKFPSRAGNTTHPYKPGK